MKDTFHTQAYKGGWIHTCQNRETGKQEVRVQYRDKVNRPAKSVQAAKRLITAHQP